MSSFAEKLFDKLIWHFSHSKTFATLASGTASFENWINAEAYALFTNLGYHCIGQPRYHDESRYRHFGDLLVKDVLDRSTNQVMIETKIISIATQD